MGVGGTDCSLAWEGGEVGVGGGEEEGEEEEEGGWGVVGAGRPEREKWGGEEEEERDSRLVRRRVEEMGWRCSVPSRYIDTSVAVYGVSLVTRLPSTVMLVQLPGSRGWLRLILPLLSSLFSSPHRKWKVCVSVPFPGENTALLGRARTVPVTCPQ